MVLKKRFRGHRTKGNVITNAINVKYDKNECFVFKKSILYLHRHLKNNFSLDMQTMEFLCWVMGNEMEQIGGYLLNFIDYNHRSEIEEELVKCGTDHEEYASILISMLKKISKYKFNKFQRFIFSLLGQRIKNLKYMRNIRH